MITKNSSGGSLSSDYTSAVQADARDVLARLVLNGVEIECAITRLTVTKGACGSTTEFTVGNLVSSTLTAEVKDLTASIKGYRVQAQIGLDVNGTYEWVTLGHFRIAEVKKNTYTATVTGYGRIVADTSGDFSIMQNPTLADVATKISTGTGGTIQFDAGIDTSQVITEPMVGLTNYQALQVLASVVGGYAVDTYDGNIKVCRFNSATTWSVDAGMMVKLPDVEEHDFTITGVECQVREASYNEQGEVAPIIYTRGTVNLKVENKFMTSDLFNSMATALTGYTYRPASVSLSLGDPRIEGTDVLAVTDIDGAVYTVPCHVLTHTYDGGFSTTIEAVRPTNQADNIGAVTPYQLALQEIRSNIVRVATQAELDLAGLKDELKEQIDAKIETWTQATNPALLWSSNAEHDGDLWLYTGTSDITVGQTTIKPQGVYKYSATADAWSAYSSTSNNLFDIVDGKSTIFYGTPTGTYTNKEVGDYLVDSTNGATYRWSGSAWVKVTDYQTYTAHAVEDATELITGGLGGYVTIVRNQDGKPTEIVIADNMDLSQAVNVWRWNQNGIGYSSTGYNGTFKTAWTIDGHFLADMITAGAISDSSGENTWNLESGQFVTKQATIGPFELTSSHLRYATGYSLFEVFNTGFRSARRLSYVGTKPYVSAFMIDDSQFQFCYTKDSTDLENVDLFTYINLQPDTTGEACVSFRSTYSYPQPTTYVRVYDATKTWPMHIDVALNVAGNFSSGGTKSRVVDTKSYDERLLYCYETPTPMFGDIGEAVLDGDGMCYVDIDDIFYETIEARVEYQVFLQKEGQGDCWVADKQRNYFVIQGTPNLKVAWELKAKQRDYESIRLEQPDYGVEQYAYSKDDDLAETYIKQQEEMLYG